MRAEVGACLFWQHIDNLLNPPHDIFVPFHKAMSSK